MKLRLGNITTAVKRIEDVTMQGSFALQILKLYLLSNLLPLLFTPLFYLADKEFGGADIGPNNTHWFAAIFIAPVLETLLFQYAVFKVLQIIKHTRGKRGVYIFISSLVFGLSHFYSIKYMVYAFSIGLVLAYTYFAYHQEGKRAFWATTFIHALYNLTVAIIIYLTI